MHGLITLTFFCCLSAAVIAPDEGSQALSIAKRLSETEFNGWRYGHRKMMNEIDCVQFVLAVSEAVLEEELNAESRRRLLIANLSTEEMKELSTLVERGDPRIRGVEYALTSAGRGTKVPFHEARPGDLVQYWFQRDHGDWVGHSGVLSDVDHSNGIVSATIFGAHASIAGIGESKFRLRLDDPAKRVFLVRLHGPRNFTPECATK